MNKNKILVLATGWHFSSHFYENMPKQIVPEGWEVDYFCVAHRTPEDENTIKEKESVREASDDNFLIQLDKKMYEYPITKGQIEEFGWEFMLEDNTIGDMEVFNQWSEKYDYKDYKLILITHDDNFILSDQLFKDILENNISIYKPLKNTRYGISNHQFQVEKIKIEESRLFFIDNGFSQDIPKMFEPRGSFCIYTKELIDMLPDNKFNMYEHGALGKVTRVGKTDSVGHEGISAWNTHAGTFRDFLYDTLPDLGLIDGCAWFSDTKRISKYCVEGERGFISNHQADGNTYVNNLKKKMEELEWI
jgi:hypothetical protein